MKTVWKNVCLAMALLLSTAAGAGSYEDFFKALETDKVEVVSQLLERGFDPNTLDPQGTPALMVALKGTSPQSLAVLLEQPELKVEVRNSHDESPLMLAALRGNLEVCKQLIDKDADVNKPGWTPLHYAATNGNTGVIQLLLDNYAYIDASSPNGSTPLMMAAMYGSPSAVKLLLEAGADPRIKNALGLTAIDFAERARKSDVTELIAAAIRARRAGAW